MSEDDPRRRVVFDCMIYLQATISESGPAAALLRLVESRAVSLFVSDEILAEVRDVLSHPKVRDDVSRHFSYPRDPKDEKYIDLAVEVDARYIISRDKDLLDLMTGHTDECKDFRRRFRPLEVIEPVEFLKVVSSVLRSEQTD